jgi:hypothetical protein
VAADGHKLYDDLVLPASFIVTGKQLHLIEKNRTRNADIEGETP